LSALLEVRDIHTAYGEARVLFGVSLEIAAGECVCLLGRNGVGKTTTIRSIMGLNPPSRGEILWRGKAITGWAPHRVARLGLGFVPEDRRIFAELTAWENLDVARRVSGRSGPWTIEAVCELFPKLAELRERQGGFLSGGEQQMLTIARTLMLNPELLLLDEPSEGRAEAAGPHDPTGRAGRRLFALALRPGVCSGKRRGSLFGASGSAAKRRRAAQQAARTLGRRLPCRS